MKTSVLSFICIFILVNQNPCIAQKKKGQARIDSLLFKLPKAKEDTNKVNLLNDLSFTYSRINPEEGIKYGERALMVAEKLNWKKGISEANNCLGINSNKKSDYIKALDYWFKSLKINEELGDKKSVSRNMGNIGNVYSDKNDYPKALEYYLKALKIMEELGDKKSVATTLTSIGNVYTSQSDFPMGLKYYFNALKMEEELGRKSGISVNLGNIGVLYLNQKDYVKALEYNLKSLQMDEELGDKSYIASDLESIGIVYKAKNDYAKAMEYYNKALKLNEELGDKSGIARNFGNLGNIYKKRIDFNTGLEFYFKALKMAEELGNKNLVAANLGNIGITYLEIAKCYSEKNKVKSSISKAEALNKANEYLNKALSVSKEIGFLAALQEFYNAKYEVQKLEGNCKEAIESYRNYTEIKDSVFSQEKAKDITRKELKFEYDKKMVADSVKSGEEKKVISAELKQEQTKSYALYGGLVLLMVFGGVMFNRFKITQKQKNIIEIKEKETQKQKVIVEQKNKEITHSIEYALRIQTAILPPTRIVKQYLENSFILYKPKDIVAGDFYWMETINSKFQISNIVHPSENSNLKSGIILFAASDCTGHGVPGAMVSVVCHNALNRAVREFGLTQPAAILDKTAEIVIENFSKSEEDIKDGMDISLCSLSLNPSAKERGQDESYTLQWAGANNPLWIVKRMENEKLIMNNEEARNYQLIETKADKQPIGMHDNNKPFTNHTFSLNRGDTIYLFTDGFADQFGGATGLKKLTRKRFKDLVLSIQHLSMQEQGLELDKFIIDFRKEIEQIDDILVMGVRL